MFMIRLLMRDDAGAIAVRAIIAQAWINGYRAAGATQACTYAFGFVIVTRGSDDGDATADGDSAALSKISATDACAPELTHGCDGAARDADVATVIIVIVRRPAADACCIGASYCGNDTAGADVDVAAMAIGAVTAANSCTAIVIICFVVITGT